MPPSPRHVPVYRAERGASSAKDISTFRERDTYVIIGRGFAAVANHLTLRASKNPEVRARVDRCRFVIIGGDEPWQARGATPLGQFPHLLGLPDYQALAGGRSYALASDFGAYIRGAEDGLNRYCDQDLRLPANAWIGLIETFDQRGTTLPTDEQTRRDEALLVGSDHKEWDRRPGYPYRLSVFWREPGDTRRRLSYLYAHYVDVCTGPGPARLLDPSVYGAGLYDEHAGQPDDQPDYQTVKRLVKGDQHIGAPLPMGPDKRILVYGASASGAWSAEHVLNRSGGAQLHWAADPAFAPEEFKSKPYLELMDGYFKSPRQSNAPGGRNLNVIESTTEQRLLGRIERIEQGTGQRLKVLWKVPSDAPGWRAKTDCEYDQVVISVGQQNEKGRAGAAAYLIQNLGVMMPLYAGDLWKNFQKNDQTIPVGLSDERGHVRVLGAANVAAPLMNSTQQKEYKDFYAEHAQSLPQEGRAAGNSILVATATVGLANRFMPTRLDANSACPSLLQRVIGHAEVATQVATARQNESYRMQPTPASERYFGKGFLTRDELKSVIVSEETLSQFTQQS